MWSCMLPKGGSRRRRDMFSSYRIIMTDLAASYSGRLDVFTTACPCLDWPVLRSSEIKEKSRGVERARIVAMHEKRIRYIIGRS